MARPASSHNASPVKPAQLPGVVLLQCCEIDRRPRQPRQLVGVSGNSARCATSIDAAERDGE